MAQKVRLGLSGLNTEANEHAAVPPGSLIQADEVVFRRAGEAGPRPSFFTYSDQSANFDTIYNLIPYDGDVLVAGDYANNMRTITGAANVNYSTAGLSWRSGDYVRHASARKNLYVAFQGGGLGKLESSSGTAFERAGVTWPTVIWTELSSSGTPAALANGKQVAYRATISKRDANDVVMESIPTPRVLRHNADGATRDVTLTVYFSDTHPPNDGDTIRIYRSRSVSSSGLPSDDTFLVTEVEVDSTDLTNGYVEYTDTSTDTELGEALYTSPSREGIRRLNLRPYCCDDITEFKGSLVLSAPSGPHYVDLSWETTVTTAFGGTPPEAGIGLRPITAVRTNGSNTITVTTSQGLRVGMIIAGDAVTNATTNSGWATLTDGVRITAINSNVLTLSSAWNSATDGAAVIMYAYDSLVIKKGSELEYYPATYLSYLLRLIGRADPGDTTFFGGTRASTLVRTIAAATVSSNSQSTRRTYSMRIESQARDDTGFELFATHGDEYNPPLPEPGASPANGYAATDGRLKNGLFLTKRNEPEHMLPTYQTAGREDIANLRVFRTRDAVWILKAKGDGIYRMTGAGERSGFRVDEWDPTTYLLHPSLACVLDDTVYAWTNRGLVALSERGVIPISSPRIGSDTDELPKRLSESNELPGAWMAANLADGEVLIGLPDMPSSGSTSNWGTNAAYTVYCYNTGTQAFSRWFTNWAADSTYTQCGVWDPGSKRMLVADSGDIVKGEAIAGTAQVLYGSDTTSSLGQMDSSSSSASTITFTGAVTVSAGDMIYQASTGTRAIVLEDASASTTVSVDTVSGFTTSSTVTLYASTEASLKWSTSGEPSLLKRYTENVTHLRDAEWMYGFDLDIENERTFGSATTVAQPFDSVSRSERIVDKRTLVPRAQSTAAQLYVKLRLKAVHSNWRLSGCTLTYEPISTRVSR